MQSVAVRVTGFVVLLAMAMPLAAQPQRGQGRGEGRGAGMMLGQVRQVVDGLNLSDDQKKRVAEVFEKTQKELEAAAAEMQNADQQERGTRMREFMMNLRGDIQTILTPEQNEQFETKLQEMRQRGGQGQPGAPGQGGGRGLQQFMRLQESLNKLDLSAEQKGQVENVMMDARSRLQELRGKMQDGGDRQTMLDEARQIMIDARDQLAAILTPAQQQQLRELMQPDAQQPGNPPATQPSKPQQPMMDPDKLTEPKANPDPPGNQQKASADAPRDVGLRVGQPAPDFALEKLDGKPVQLSSFKGRLTVLMFGSYSSPAFRKRAAAFNDLAREYGSRAQFLLIYTKETHPAGGWEVDANRDAKISIPPHKSLDERKELAKRAKDALKVNVPIAVDSMDDSAANAYGAHENDAILIGKDGKILLAQNWMDPYGLKRALDSAIQAKPSTQPSP